MKSLNLKEIEQLASALKLLGATTLNAIYTQAPIITLEFYNSEGLVFLVVDLTPGRPMALLFKNKTPIKLLKKYKPLSLFLKANFASKKLIDIEFSQELGRLIRLHFEGGSLLIELRIFPHGQNIICTANDKSIAWIKPKELVALNDFDMSELVARTHQVLAEEWLESQRPALSKGKRDLAKELESLQKKREKTLKKLNSDILNSESKRLNWQRIAKLLESNLAEPLLATDDSLVEEGMSAPQKMEYSFDKVKSFSKKILRQKERYLELEKELQQISISDLKNQNQKQTKSRVVENLKVKRWTLPSGLVAAVGRNAKENVDLLRKAKPWDIWLHLKDFPGAYGFIFRNRKQNVIESELDGVAEWVARMSLKNKIEKMSGESLEIVMTECRYLQLIKGDKLGRVTYKNAKTFKVIIK